MTLRAKIATLVVAVTALVLLGVGAVLARSFEGWSAEAGTNELLERAAAIASRIELEDEGEEGGRLQVEEHAAVLRDPGHPWRIVGRGRDHLGAPGDLAWPAPRFDARHPEVQTVSGADGRAWRVASAAFDVGGEHGRARVVVQVAGGVAPFGALEGPFRRGLLIALAGALLLAGLGATALAHVSLAPLRRLAADIAATGVTSLDRRVRTDGLDPELRSVATAFNELLERLDGAMLQQRQLVSRASHALRTPVATIRTRAEVSLRREREPQAYRDALAEIGSAARDASGLIAQLLTLARLDERREPLAREEVALAPLANEVVRLLAPRAEEAGISLELAVDEGHRVPANRGALRELLEALLDNAVRYTPQGGRAGVATTVAAGRCRLAVWDTGPGVPEDERNQIFDRFYRGSVGLASSQQGSGLGLAVVKAIADAHGATVESAPHPGGGLEVSVVFPA